MIDFRRYNQVSVDFAEGMNILHGENGAGKTTILEAVHCLSYMRSFKTHFDSDLLKHGQETFRLKGSFINLKGYQQEVRLEVKPGKRKQVQINGKKIPKRADIIGRLPLVSLTPEDSDLTFGAPEVRRQFINKLFSQVDKPYLKALQDYHRILKQRNAMLSAYAADGTPVDPEYLDSIDEQMAGSALIIHKSRQKHFDQLKALVYHSYGELERDKSFKMALITNVRQQDTSDPDFRKAFKLARGEDMRRGTSSRGPHRDLLRMYLNSKDLKKFGSQGEHKLVLVALKFAEGRFLESHLKEPPIFLLDDLFAELDVQRSMQIVTSLRGSHQIFITATDLADLRTHGMQVEEGNIRIIDAGDLKKHEARDDGGPGHDPPSPKSRKAGGAASRSPAQKKGRHHAVAGKKRGSTKNVRAGSPAKSDE